MRQPVLRAPITDSTLRRIFCGLTFAAIGYLSALMALAAWSPGTIKRHQIESASFILATTWLACLVTTKPARSPSAKPGVDAQTFWGCCGIGAALGAASLWQVALVGPLSDDFVLESWAAAGRYFGEGSGFARPAVIGVWRGALELGAGSRALHVLNLLLHAANTLLLVAVARRIGANPIAAGIAGAVFLCWPTQIEAVAWTSGMFDVAMTAAVLGALLLTAPEDPPARQLAGLGCLLLALLSKETAVAFPLLWLTCYLPRLVDRRVAAARVMLAGAVVSGIVVVYLVWRAFLRLPLAGVHEISRYTVKEQLSRTFAGLCLPFSAETVSAHPWIGLVVPGFFLLLVAAIALNPRDGSQRTALQGLAWAVFAAAPTIGYLFIGPDLDGSRYLYLPCAGWGLFVAAGIRQIGGWPLRATLIVPCAVVAVLVLMERQRLVNQWVEAGRARDAILSAAATAAATNGCDDVTFAGLPRRFRGAQLFNNGAAEAFARVRGPATGSRPCRLDWDHDRFTAR